MRAFFNHVKIQLLLDVRNKGTLLTFYLIPILFYLALGSVFSAVQPLAKETLGASMTIFGVSMGAVLGLPPSIVQMREAGALRSLRVNGVPGWSVLASRCISAFINLFIVSLLIFATVPALFGASVPVNMTAYFLTLVLLIFASIMLGILIGVAAKSQSMATMLSQAIFMPSLLLGGLMFPASMLPEQMQMIGRLFPATHAMMAFSGWSFALDTPVAPLIANTVVAAIGVCSFIIAVLRFKKISVKM